MKAILLAAGLGTRLKPFTDKHPKALYPFKNKTILQRAVEYLQQANIFEIIINVHHFPQQIINHVNQAKGWGATILFSEEKEELLETGGAVWKAKSFLSSSENFVVINVDIITNFNLSMLIDFHLKANSIASLAISQRPSSRQLLFNQNFELMGWQNAKKNERKLIVNYKEELNLYPFAFNGIQVINSQVFNYLHWQGKFSIIDAYLTLAKDYLIKGFDCSKFVFFDLGKTATLSSAPDI